MIDENANGYYEFVDRCPDIPEPADFSVINADNSMEPFLKSGADVYVSTSKAPEEFGAAVFFVDGKILCRRWCEDSFGTLYLLPVNPAYQGACTAVPIYERHKCFCLGSVIFDGTPPKPAYIYSGSGD